MEGIQRYSQYTERVMYRDNYSQYTRELWKVYRDIVSILRGLWKVYRDIASTLRELWKVYTEI